MKVIKPLLSLFLCSVSLLVTAQIKIISDESVYKADIGSSWSSNPKLSYSNTLWGETFYNAGWKDMNQAGNIEYETVAKVINYSPDTKRSWSLTIPIKNLNAKAGYEYSSPASPSKRQDSEQIYWGIQIDFIKDGVSQSLNFMFKRADSKGKYGNEYISYSVGNDGWKDSFYRYPSCDKENNTELKIETHSYNSTTISWGEVNLTNFGAYIDEISSIQLIVGTQANIQVGKVDIYCDKIENNTTADELIAENKCYEAKGALLRAIRLYGSAENLYYPLALCYGNLRDYKECIDITTVLIQFQGRKLYESYLLRGVAKESINDNNGALADYKSAGTIGKEYYDNLFLTMYKSKSVSRKNGKHIKYKH